MSDYQKKHWVFTINNYSEEEREKVVKVFEDECTYGVVGREVGGSGTPHLQGYVVLGRKRRRAQVVALLGGRAFVEEARGTPVQASEYCKKGNDYEERGKIPRVNGKRKTRDELAVEFVGAVQGGTLDEFRTENPGTWAWDGERLVRNFLVGVRAMERPGIDVQWIWGNPGVGKSRMAHGLMPTAYVKDPRTKWWNGYMLETEVIIDDFGPNGIDINHLLRWFDRYRCYVEVKGSMVALRAEKFIVTSNFSPTEVFTDEKSGVVHAQVPALLRRIRITHMGEFTVNGAN